MATLPVEETESSEEIEGLVYKRLEGRYRGWRVELLEEQLTSKLEERFLLCSYCSGVMRDACLLEREGKQELRCLVCIPEGLPWQPLEMNREAINEKIVSIVLFCFVLFCFVLFSLFVCLFVYLFIYLLFRSGVH